MKKNIVIVVATLVLLLCFVSCASAPKTLTATPSQIPKATLPNGVSVASVATSATGNFLTGIATVTNNSNDTQTVYYKFVWVNSDGTVNEDSNPWTPLQMMPKLSKTVTSTATTQNTASFRIILSASQN